MWRDCLLLACVSLVIYGIGIGRLKLRHEEPRRALVAREMLDGGHWLVPRLNGEPYLAKPPAYSWQVAAVAAVMGGVTETAARLPSALSVLGMALLLYWIGRTFMTPRAGLLAGLMVATSAGIVAKGTQAEVDASLTFWVTASLCFLYRAWGGRGRYDWAVSYVLLGVALLTKGPVALLFFAAGIAAIAWVDRDVSPLRTARDWLGVAGLVVPVALWLAAVQRDVGLAALLGAARGEIVERVIGWSVLDPRQILFYPVAVAGSLLPWTPVLVVAVAPLLRGTDPVCRLTRFSLAVSILSIAVFSLSAGKAARYLLPIVPMLSLAAAGAADRFMSGDLPPRLARLAGGGVGAAAIFAGVVVAVMGPVAALQWSAPVPLAAAITAVGVALTLGGGLAASRRRWGAAIAVTVGAVCAFRAVQVWCYVPYVNARRDLDSVVGPLNAALAPGAPVYTVTWRNMVVFYYLDAPVRRAGSVKDLADRALAGGPIQCFVTGPQRAYLQRVQPGAWRQSAAFRWQGAEVFLLASAGRERAGGPRIDYAPG